jgi:hypothetical protein
MLPFIPINVGSGEIAQAGVGSHKALPIATTLIVHDLTHEKSNGTHQSTTWLYLKAHFAIVIFPKPVFKLGKLETKL